MANSINILKPSVCFEVEKIIGISTSEGCCKSYQVIWAPSWISGVHLVGCEDLIEQFEQEEKEKEPNIKVEVVDVYDVQGESASTCDDEIDKGVMQNADIPSEASKQRFIEHIHNVGSLYRSRANPPSPCPNNKKNSSISLKVLSQNSTIQHYGQDNSNQHTDTMHPYFKGLESKVANTHNNSSNAECGLLSFQSDVPIRKDYLKGDGGNSIRATFVVTPASDYSQTENTLTSDRSFEHGTINSSDNNENKAYICNICNKIFSCDRSLKNHSKLHTDIYQCIICYRNFTSKRNLQRHELIHSEGRRYPCSFCKKIFNDNVKLELHLETHTTQVCHFQCTYCTKIFLTNTRLKRHMRVHTGERPFECKVCHKGFKMNHHLQGHIKTHLVGDNIQEEKVEQLVDTNIQEHSMEHLVYDDATAKS